ncbi:MAG: zinc ribbon domain-containing protein [Kosmotogaceae bacterium]|nr:zinc ribbon domain-containing protein [Kosmotogaceae bacterium]
MYSSSNDSAKTIIKLVGVIVYAVGIGLIIFSFAGIFLAPYLSIVFGSVFVFVVLGFIATTLGRMLINMAKTKSFSGPVSEQEPVSRQEVQEDMTYDYTFVSDREARIQKTKSKSYSRCPECGTENDDKANKCSSCGTSLIGYKKCSLCYMLNKKENRFCKNCGHDFNLD